MSKVSQRFIVSKSTSEIEKKFTSQLEKDPTAFIELDSIIKAIAEKHNIPVKLANSIIMHQFAVTRQTMMSDSFPTVKLKYFGKLFVSKGRRYYNSIIKQASKDKL